MNGEGNSLAVHSEAELWGWNLGPLKRLNIRQATGEYINVGVDNRSRTEIAMCMLGWNSKFNTIHR